MVLLYFFTAVSPSCSRQGGEKNTPGFTAFSLSAPSGWRSP
jgi:hypothetical protein